MTHDKNLEEKLKLFASSHKYEWDFICDDVYLILPFHKLKEFISIFGTNEFNNTFDEGYSILLKGNYIVIEMRDVCDYFGLNIGDIFPKIQS